MKKVIAALLTGTMILGIASCAKNQTKETKLTPADTKQSETNETGDNWDEIGYKTNYLLDKIDKDEIYTIIDGFYLGDPQKGETVQAVYDRVTGHINKPNGGYSIFGYRGSDIIIEFANTNDVELDGWWINGRDNVCAMTYSGYQIDWDIGDAPTIILGNRKSYTDHDYPAGGGVYFHIYDEARAKQLHDILCRYIDTKFPDLIREVRSEKLVGYAAYLPTTDKTKALDYIASTNMFYNEEIKCWEVVYFASFPSIGEVDKDGNPIDIEESKTTTIDENGETTVPSKSETIDTTETDESIVIIDESGENNNPNVTVNPDEDGVAHT